MTYHFVAFGFIDANGFVKIKSSKTVAEFENFDVSVKINSKFRKIAANFKKEVIKSFDSANMKEFLSFAEKKYLKKISIAYGISLQCTTEKDLKNHFP